MNCKRVFEELEPRLKHLGKVVLAGGCVRDELRGEKPKDYDVFVLFGKAFDPVQAQQEIAVALSDMYHDEHGEASGDGTLTVCDVDFEGSQVQVIAVHQSTLTDLVETFDWCICMYGWDENGPYRHPRSETPFAGGYLKLNRVDYPVSTLRRGFRFCDRLQMLVDKADLNRLCTEVLAATLTDSELEREACSLSVTAL